MFPVYPSLKLETVDSGIDYPPNKRKLIENLEKQLEQEKARIRNWKFDPKQTHSDKPGGNQLWQQEQLGLLRQQALHEWSAQQQQQQQQGTGAATGAGTGAGTDVITGADAGAAPSTPVASVMNTMQAPAGTMSAGSSATSLGALWEGNLVVPRAAQGQPIGVLEQLPEEVDVEMEDDDYDDDEEEEEDQGSFGEDPQNLQTDIFY